MAAGAVYKQRSKERREWAMEAACKEACSVRRQGVQNSEGR